MPAPKHGKGWLQDQIVSIMEDIESGKIEITDGKHATPHRLAQIVQVKVKDDEAPSTGAVAAVLHRMVKIGYITVHPKPFAFKAITAAGRKLGRDGLQAKANEAAKVERAKAKAANPPKAKAKTASKAPAKKAASKAPAKKTGRKKAPAKKAAAK